MESFGELIRNLRKEKKLPLRTVAEFLDIDQAILSKIERGQRKASREIVRKCAEYFNADENQLLITWLSDKLVYEIRDEEAAIDALQMAEEKVGYRKTAHLAYNELLTILSDFFKKDGRISRAWLFGSFARNENKAYSDIDLMVSYSEKASGTLLDYADIRQKLEILLGCRVDLVEEGYVKSFAKESINRDKVLIYG
jgi:predicted nucleotidyltransferase